ncbi:unnamed protein product, partial [Amoebophrya sp. A120]
VIFITERVTGGSLRNYVNRLGGPLKLKVIRNWAHQILEGLQYLHSTKPNPVIHRDLKCDNIFINGNVGQILIGDLGLSSWLKKDNSRSHSGYVAQSIVGTPEFMAPELYDERYGTPVDIYAFGMCLVELTSRQFPFVECQTTMQVYNKVMKGEQPRVVELIKDPNLKDLIQKCLQKDPNLRPSAEEATNHPFIHLDSAADASYLDALCELLDEQEVFGDRQVSQSEEELADGMYPAGHSMIDRSRVNVDEDDIGTEARLLPSQEFDENEMNQLTNQQMNKGAVVPGAGGAAGPSQGLQFNEYKTGQKVQFEYVPTGQSIELPPLDIPGRSQERDQYFKDLAATGATALQSAEQEEEVGDNTRTGGGGEHVLAPLVGAALDPLLQMPQNQQSQPLMVVEESPIDLNNPAAKATSLVVDPSKQPAAVPMGKQPMVVGQNTNLQQDLSSQPQMLTTDGTTAAGVLEAAVGGSTFKPQSSSLATRQPPPPPLSQPRNIIAGGGGGAPVQQQQIGATGGGAQQQQPQGDQQLQATGKAGIAVSTFTTPQTQLPQLHHPIPERLSHQLHLPTAAAQMMQFAQQHSNQQYSLHVHPDTNAKTLPVGTSIAGGLGLKGGGRTTSIGQQPLLHQAQQNRSTIISASSPELYASINQKGSETPRLGKNDSHFGMRSPVDRLMEVSEEQGYAQDDSILLSPLRQYREPVTLAGAAAGGLAASANMGVSMSSGAGGGKGGFDLPPSQQLQQLQQQPGQPVPQFTVAHQGLQQGHLQQGLAPAPQQQQQFSSPLQQPQQTQQQMASPVAVPVGSSQQQASPPASQPPGSGPPDQANISAASPPLSAQQQQQQSTTQQTASTLLVPPLALHQAALQQNSDGSSALPSTPDFHRAVAGIEQQQQFVQDAYAQQQQGMSGSYGGQHHHHIANQQLGGITFSAPAQISKQGSAATSASAHHQQMVTLQQASGGGNYQNAGPVEFSMNVVEQDWNTSSASGAPVQQQQFVQQQYNAQQPGVDQTGSYASGPVATQQQVPSQQLQAGAPQWTTSSQQVQQQQQAQPQVQPQQLAPAIHIPQPPQQQQQPQINSQQHTTPTATTPVVVITPPSNSNQSSSNNSVVTPSGSVSVAAVTPGTVGGGGTNNNQGAGAAVLPGGSVSGASSVAGSSTVNAPATPYTPVEQGQLGQQQELQQHQPGSGVGGPQLASAEQQQAHLVFRQQNLNQRRPPTPTKLQESSAPQNNLQLLGDIKQPEASANNKIPAESVISIRRVPNGEKRVLKTKIQQDRDSESQRLQDSTDPNFNIKKEIFT